MRSLSVSNNNGTVSFGQSKRYQKRGINVVVLHGEPFEIGYSRGILLKKDIRTWVRDVLYMI